jgi:hypothetical protein
MVSTRHDILQHTNGVGANAVIVATFNSDALNIATASARMSSKINIFGGMPTETRIPIRS